jgi:hypothetical protein
MAHSETRPGFRLPWTTEHGDPAQPAVDTTPEPSVVDDVTPADEATTPIENTPAEEPVTTEMIDATATAGTRRPTKFMAEMSRAMQGAAEAARDETLARLEADLKTVVEEIHAASTVEAAELRRRADDDVAAVREWSKAEIARIREETEARIALRKTALDSEMEAHTGTIGARVEQVGATVLEYESVMADFFERLRAEADPSRIATMAETMPDPPDLAYVAASIAGPAVIPFHPAQPVVVDAPESEADGQDAPESTDASPSSEADFAAAEAEAATFTGDLEDEHASRTMTTEHDEADNARLAATADDISAPSERTTTRVVVVGLVSVASIATFKRSLGRVPGVSAIGVASGPDGEFIFTVSHGSTLDLSAAIRGLSGFDAEVSDETSGGLQVTAHDPDTSA